MKIFIYSMLLISMHSAFAQTAPIYTQQGGLGHVSYPRVDYSEGYNYCGDEQIEIIENQMRLQEERIQKEAGIQNAKCKRKTCLVDFPDSSYAINCKGDGVNYSFRMIFKCTMVYEYKARNLSEFLRFEKADNNNSCD